MIRTAIVSDAIDVPALIREVTSEATGATTLFLGTVRDVNDGRDVTGIEYTAYAGMASDELQRIAVEAQTQFDGVRVAVEHRIGTLGLSDVSVAIAVAHARRTQAMDASRFIIEELKRRVPIWKCEHYADGERQWIDPTASRASVVAS
ncbi:MAG: molybdenum cofactor biosynthesis protein MoaE [Gemmatimonadaceae bacterium]|nr:molybdenum cofactor biosynthesis protein MoaE [Gemmatimonadaceae bacterium]